MSERNKLSIDLTEGRKNFRIYLYRRSPDLFWNFVKPESSRHINNVSELLSKCSEEQVISIIEFIGFDHHKFMNSIGFGNLYKEHEVKFKNNEISLTELYKEYILIDRKLLKYVERLSIEEINAKISIRKL